MSCLGLVVTGCSSRPGSLAERCSVATPCEDLLVCEEGVCLLPAVDAGAPAPDASRADVTFVPDATTTTDAVPPDAEPAISSGPRLPLPSPNTFSLPPGISDLSLDFERHRLFLSRGRSGRVTVLDLRSGESGSIEVGHDVVLVAFDPFSDTLAIVSLEATPSSSGPDRAWLDAVDAGSFVVRSHAELTIRPTGIVVDARGRAYISADGSQGATIDLATGETTLTYVGHSLGTHPNIAIHPDGDRLYVSPDVGFRFVHRLSATRLAEFEYEGAEGTRGTIRIDPSGDLLYTSLGRIHRATNDRDTDMLWVMDTPPWQDLAFLPSRAGLLVIREGALVRLETPASEPGERLLVEGRPVRVFAGPEYWVVVSQTETGAPQAVISVRAYD